MAADTTPLDAAADGAFGGKGAVSHRAGYTDALYWSLRPARNGGTLAAGEGLLIIQHYEAQLADLRAHVNAQG